MVRCPKCNNEYNEQLPKCPVCGYNPQEDVEKILEETKSLYSDGQTVIHSDNDMQYHDGFDSPMDDQGAPSGMESPQNQEDTAPVPPVNGAYQDGYGAQGAPDRVPEKLKEYNVDVNTAYKKQRKIPLGVKIIIAVVVVLAALTAALFATGVFKIDNGSFVFRPENLPGVTSQSPTDANGNPVSSGGNASPQAPTDANGNPIPNQSSASSTSGNQVSSGNASSSGSSAGNNSSAASSPDKNPSSGSSSGGNSSSSGSNSSSGGDVTGTAATINGKEYQIGDTVTYTAYLGGISKPVCGVDASVIYNSSMLTINEDSIKFPNIGNPVYNTKERDEFLFNSTNLEGFNFASEAVLVSVSFTVKAAGTCDISLTTRELIDFDGQQLEGDNRDTVSKS